MSYGTTASRQVLFFIDTEQLLKLLITVLCLLYQLGILI